MFFCIIEEESTQDNMQDNSYTGNVFMENSHNEPKYIEVRGACVHNLKNVNVNVPLHQIAGIDGDGCKYRFAGNRGFKGCASAAGSAQKSARTFFGECDQSRGDEQKFMEVKNIIVLRYCWDSMWQSRFFCTILRETCQKPERWQTAHDKTGFQKSWTGASEY